MRLTIAIYSAFLSLATAAPQISGGALPIPAALLTLIPPQIITAIPPEILTAVPIDIVPSLPTDLAGLLSLFSRVTADVGGLSSINLPAKPTSGPSISDALSITRSGTDAGLTFDTRSLSSTPSATTTVTTTTSQEMETETVLVTETSASVASQTEATAAATSSSAASLERKPAVVVPALLGVAAWFL